MVNDASFFLAPASNPAGQCYLSPASFYISFLYPQHLRVFTSHLLHTAMAAIPESHHTIPIKNVETGFLLTAAIDGSGELALRRYSPFSMCTETFSVAAHPEGFVGVANGVRYPFSTIL